MCVIRKHILLLKKPKDKIKSKIEQKSNENKKHKKKRRVITFREKLLRILP